MKRIFLSALLVFGTLAYAQIYKQTWKQQYDTATGMSTFTAVVNFRVGTSTNNSDANVVLFGTGAITANEISCNYLNVTNFGVVGFLKTDGSNQMLGDLNVGGYNITNLGLNLVTTTGGTDPTTFQSGGITFNTNGGKLLYYGTFAPTSFSNYDIPYKSYNDKQYLPKSSGTVIEYNSAQLTQVAIDTTTLGAGIGVWIATAASFLNMNGKDIINGASAEFTRIQASGIITSDGYMMSAGTFTNIMQSGVSISTDITGRSTNIFIPQTGNYPGAIGMNNNNPQYGIDFKDVIGNGYRYADNFANELVIKPVSTTITYNAINGATSHIFGTQGIQKLYLGYGVVIATPIFIGNVDGYMLPISTEGAKYGDVLSVGVDSTCWKTPAAASTVGMLTESSATANYLNSNYGTMNGLLDMNSNDIINAAAIYDSGGDGFYFNFISGILAKGNLQPYTDGGETLGTGGQGWSGLWFASAGNAFIDNDTGQPIDIRFGGAGGERVRFYNSGIQMMNNAYILSEDNYPSTNTMTTKGYVDQQIAASTQTQNATVSQLQIDTATIRSIQQQMTIDTTTLANIQTSVRVGTGTLAAVQISVQIGTATLAANDVTLFAATGTLAGYDASLAIGTGTLAGRQAQMTIDTTTLAGIQASVRVGTATLAGIDAGKMDNTPGVVASSGIKTGTIQQTNMAVWYSTNSTTIVFGSTDAVAANDLVNQVVEFHAPQDIIFKTWVLDENTDTSGNCVIQVSSAAWAAPHGAIDGGTLTNNTGSPRLAGQSISSGTTAGWTATNGGDIRVKITAAATIKKVSLTLFYWKANK